MVRLGLALIRALVALKALVLRVGGFFSRLLAPFSRFLLRAIILPIYGVVFGIQRRLGQFYRPAKNRLMFLVTNRYVVHATVISVAVVAGVVNLQLTEVRAAAGTFGQQSLLYRIVTEEDVEIIEERAQPTDIAVGTVAPSSNGILTPSVGTAIAPSTGTAMALGGGSLTLAAPNTDRSLADSVVPRTSTITYTVAEGDTLSTIAQQFGLSLNTVLWANSLTGRSLIKPGMNLAILPVDGVEHTVKSGDTLSTIAKKYNVESDAILAYNNIDGASLGVGQELLVPGGTVQAAPPVTRTVAVRDIFTPAPSGAGGTTTLDPGARMVWPTDLRYIVRKLSWFHTGWDIDCNGHADGTSTNDNYAAMDGVVQYSGAKSGYGLTVEINHGNGLVTRYGHFHTLYVSAGDSVSAGTPLGRCGSTGNSTGTHLHFEVIVNGSFQNPGGYLGY